MVVEISAALLSEATVRTDALHFSYWELVLEWLRDPEVGRLGDRISPRSL